MAVILKLAGNMFNAWLMKPVYQAIIVLLIIIIIWMYLKNQKEGGS